MSILLTPPTSIPPAPCLTFTSEDHTIISDTSPFPVSGLVPGVRLHEKLRDRGDPVGKSVLRVGRPIHRSINSCGNAVPKGPEILTDRRLQQASTRMALTYRTSEAILRIIPRRVVAVGTSQRSSHPVSELLMRWRDGGQQALQRLVPLVYRELRDIARHHLHRERPGHTLESAALVHEAYLRLVGQKPFDAENRAHFLAVASRLM